MTQLQTTNNDIESTDLPWKIGQLLLGKNGERFRFMGKVDGNKVTLDKLTYSDDEDEEEGPQLEWKEYYSHYTLSEWKYYYDFVLVDSFESLEDEATRAMSNLSAYLNSQGLDQAPSQDTALMAPMSKNGILALKDSMQNKIDRAEAIKRIIEVRMSHLTSWASKVRKELIRVERIIDVIELYLGINEEIHLLRDGQPAPLDTLISIRQLTLWMDEEAGDPRDGGIDWTKIEDFDEWLLKDNHLDQLLPEIKGMVALRPSRQERTYSDNPWVNAEANAKNKMCYLLIRNGEKVYRIWTNTFLPDSEFFPTKEKMAKILKDLDSSSWDKEKAEKIEVNYRKNAMIVQGLIDRTDIFSPIHPEAGLRSQEGLTYIQFIHDAEDLLPSGKLPYAEWKKQANNKIGLGSRILLGPLHSPYKKEWADRFVRYYGKDGWSAPALPKPGVYTVEKVLNEASIYSSNITYNWLVIYYQPGGTVRWSWDYWDEHDRKNRVGFKLDRGDPMLFNYDLISLDDIEFYLGNRLERKNYLEIIPLLWEMREQRLKEIEQEKHFVNLLSHETGVKEDVIWQAVQWWKIDKVKWTRPLTQNDAKAWRMIKNRVLKNETKKIIY